HTAYSRDVFAAGAVKAAKFITGIKKPGMYDMQDLL
ncbi:MAG: 4-hydroxy-tetrahydrodipicolinate reductase, partial [Clostridiales bacterium]|nr:4-hydroxy-tetrahydrodipicolinate reductase [Clostridiales bacterium]